MTQSRTQLESRSLVLSQLIENWSLETLSFKKKKKKKPYQDIKK
jgi:hypothetical protein